MLRNVSHILNYVLLAADGEIGRCRDFLYDDEKWTIWYMVADSRKWLPGRMALVSSQRITEVDGGTENLWVDLTTNNVKNSPEYDPLAPINRDYECALHDHDCRRGYWE